MSPRILLLDLTPDVTFGVLSDIKRVVQECKLVLWVSVISTELAFQGMGLGVRGILRKTLSAELQVKCLDKVQEGELWFERALTDSFLAAKRVVLSCREGQLITLLSRGMKNKEIGATLQITEGTVKVYLSHLFTKVGVKDRFELALFGLKNLTGGHGQSSEEPGRVHDAPIPNLRSLVMERPQVRPVASPSAGRVPALAPHLPPWRDSANRERLAEQPIQTAGRELTPCLEWTTVKRPTNSLDPQRSRTSLNLLLSPAS